MQKYLGQNAPDLISDLWRDVDLTLAIRIDIFVEYLIAFRHALLPLLEGCIPILQIKILHLPPKQQVFIGVLLRHTGQKALEPSFEEQDVTCQTDGGVQKKRKLPRLFSSKTVDEAWDRGCVCVAPRIERGTSSKEINTYNHTSRRNKQAESNKKKDLSHHFVLPEPSTRVHHR